MLISYIVCVVLPAHVFGRIQIAITNDGPDYKIIAIGEEKELISDEEIKTFGLDMANLKKAAKSRYGGPTDDEGNYCFVKGPEPPKRFSTSYEKRGFDEVHRILKVSKAEILGITSIPEAVASSVFINHNKRAPTTFSSTLSKTLTTTNSHTWSKGSDITVGQEINYSINVGVGSAGGTTSLSYSSSWNEDTTEEKSVTLGTSSTILVTLNPGEQARAVLSATKGTLEAEITYEASVEGDVFCYFDNQYENIYNWGYGVQYIRRELGLPEVFTTTEKISIGYYTDSYLEISDGESDEVIDSAKAGIIKA